MTPATTDPGTNAAAVHLRKKLTDQLAGEGLLNDPEWRAAVETVPRHWFVPGFYIPDVPRSGLTTWEPVTERINRDRWLRDIHTDQTLVTQLDGDEPDWNQPTPRAGGCPTSSSTLPSLVLRMWAAADLAEGQQVLEVGTGTGYSTALYSERFGSIDLASIEVDSHRLSQASAGLRACGYGPHLAVADGLYGYAPYGPYDRIVAACSVRTIPPAWLAQTRPGGKILTTFSGWLNGNSRVLLTVDQGSTAEGPLLPGTVSFMSARADTPPQHGPTHHWARLTRDAKPLPTSIDPARLGEATEEGFYARFIAQLAAPNTQRYPEGEVTHLIDVVTGSAATISPKGDLWEVRQAGPVRLWDAIEAALSAWDDAGKPPPETFRMSVDRREQRIEHPTAEGLSFVLP